MTGENLLYAMIGMVIGIIATAWAIAMGRYGVDRQAYLGQEPRPSIRRRHGWNPRPDEAFKPKPPPPPPPLRMRRDERAMYNPPPPPDEPMPDFTPAPPPPARDRSGPLC